MINPDYIAFAQSRGVIIETDAITDDGFYSLIRDSIRQQRRQFTPNFDHIRDLENFSDLLDAQKVDQDSQLVQNEQTLPEPKPDQNRINPGTESDQNRHNHGTTDDQTRIKTGTNEPRRLKISELDPPLQDHALELLEKMSYDNAIKRVLQDFGVIICKSSLRRFNISKQAERALQTQNDLNHRFTELAIQLATANADYSHIAEQLLALRLAEYALDESHSLHHIAPLVPLTEKLRAGRLAERKLQLAEKKQSTHKSVP